MKCVLVALLLLAAPPETFQLKRMLKSKDLGERTAAVEELWIHWTKAQYLTTELLKVAVESDGLLQERTVEILGRAKFDFREAAKQQAVLLTDADATKREAAVRLLALIGSPAADAHAPSAAKLLADETERVRAAAAATLMALDHEAEKALAEIATAAVSKDAAVRVHAARGYGWSKALVKTAVDALAILLKDKDPVVRFAAARAHGDLGDRARTAIFRLRKLRRDKDAGVRGQAARAFGKLGKHAKPAVKEVIAMLGDRDATVRQYAAEALAELTEFSFPLLLDALEGKKKTPLLNALTALARFEDRAKEAVPVMVGLIRHDDRDIQLAALETLGALGAIAKDALPEIRLLAYDARDHKVKKAAKQAKARIEAALQ